MIHCISRNRNTYYVQGIYPSNIPFLEFEKIYLLKSWIINSKLKSIDYFPVFKRFQRYIKLRYKWAKNPRNILNRELYGTPLILQSQVGAFYPPKSYT
jgi:hypothetical protein